MNKVINPAPLGGGGGGLVPTIRATAPVGSSVTCDGQTKVVGAEGFVDFVVSAEPVNILPDGVQGLESIESTGGQYINTGIAPNNRQEIGFVFFLKNNDNTQGLYGSSYNTNYGSQIERSGGTWYCANGDTRYTMNFQNFIVGEDYEVSVDKDFVIVNGQSQSVPSTNRYKSTTVFFRNGYTSYLKGGMKGAYIAEDGNAVINLYPCIYNSQVGMWDVVSNSFFGNQGTGSFIAGEPKEYLDYPTYTVTANGISKTVTIEGVELRTVSF